MMHKSVDAKGEGLASLNGTVLADKFALKDLLGSGGMGVVYRAEQLGLNRTVAVKVLHPDLLKTRLDWFKAEAMAASRINHPNAVSIYDFGVSEDGLAFLVMEHLRGQSLARIVDRHRVGLERAVALAQQTLSALAEAHACNVVHCDLTPSNLIVEKLRDDSDFVKVIDFGLARLFELQGEGNLFAGTPEYAAPEQIRGEPLTEKTDIYSVGTLLFEMVVGRTPFSGELLEVLHCQLGDEPPMPHEVTNCPLGLSELISQCLQKDASKRPASAIELSERLAEVTHRRRPVSVVEAQPTALVAPLPPAEESPTRVTRMGALRGVPSPFVGRKTEIAKVRRFAVGQSQSRLLTVSGPHGIGKARLVNEACNGMDLGFPAYSGGPDPSGLKSSWYPILAALEQVLGLQSSPTVEALRRAAESVGVHPRDLPGLREAFGLEGGDSQLELAVRRRETRAAVLRTLLSAGEREGRALFFFADVDRYDLPSIELIKELIRQGGEQVSVLLTAEDSAEFTAFGGEEISLAGLSEEHSRELFEGLLEPQADDVAPEMARLVEFTEGTPAAIEQLAGWFQSGHAVGAAPNSLADVVSMRLGRLSAEARRVLQAVAIHGNVAKRTAVESRIDDASKQALMRDNWTGLLVVELEHLTIPTDFVAKLVSESTPLDVRRNLHRGALASATDRDPPGVLGHHAEQSGAIKTAYTFYLKAGALAERRFDDQGAAGWYGRAVRCARQLHASGEENAHNRLVEASVQLAEILRQSQQFALAEGVCEEAELFDADELRRSMLSRVRGLIAHAKGDNDTAVRALTQAIGGALRSGNRDFLCRCYLDFSATLDSVDPERGTRELLEAIDVITFGEGITSGQTPSRLWRLYLALGERYQRAGSLELAKDVASTAFERVPDRHAQGRLAALLASICDAMNDSRAAREYRHLALRAMQEIGDRRSTATLLLQSISMHESPSKEALADAHGLSAQHFAEKLQAELAWSEAS